jgi:hypothetical protein
MHYTKCAVMPAITRSLGRRVGGGGMTWEGTEHSTVGNTVTHLARRWLENHRASQIFRP